MPIVSGGGGGGAFTGGTIAGPLTIADGSGLGTLTLSGNDYFAVDTGGSATLTLLQAGVSSLDMVENSLSLTDLVAGAYVFLVTLNYALFGYTAAPNSAALAAGQFALWLDATPGATKLMVKAKDSGGTVRTAAIALA